MANKTDASGCFVFLTIVVGLVFWQVSLILISISIIIAIVISLQNQGFSEYARKWEKIHVLSPCVYKGQYGFIEGVTVDGGHITMSIKPIRTLLPNSSISSDTFSTKISTGSFQHAMRQLFKQNSIEYLQGVSVELSAIESALKCHEQFIWCVESMNALVKMSDQIDRALSLAHGNPLLEPSVPAMEFAKAKITNESLSITKAKEFSLDTLKDLVDYLSVPEELRQLSEITELESVISIRHDNLRTSFNELLEFNNEYVKLIR